MKLFLYNLILFALTPFFALRILYKSFYDKDYRLNFLQRFGILSLKNINVPDTKIIWFHAVSLGEVIASQKMVKSLTKNYIINLTVSTPTGLRQAKKLYRNYDINISYAPWDFYYCVNAFMKNIRPDLIIVFETEIWPSMIYIASKNNIPVLLSNGRMSMRSYSSYKKFNFFSKEIFNMLNKVLAQSIPHAERFKDLGVKSSAIQVTGTVKFDLIPAAAKSNSDLDSFVKTKNILAVSTHHGEDEIMLRAFSEVLTHFPNIKLIIVPRHPERAAAISKLADKKNISACIESEGIDTKSSILIINSIGNTSALYESAEAVFVGGSLVERGGHNIIEPAFFACPIIIGPHMFNFESIAEEFRNNASCKVVHDSKSLANEFINLLANKDEALMMTEAASKILVRNSGASDRQLSVIMDFLEGVNE